MAKRTMADTEQVYIRALTAHEHGDAATAAELYEEILAQFPDADVVLYNQGLALFDLERFAEAVSVFSRAAELRRDDADTWYNLALALKREQRYAEATDAYKRALALQPDDQDVLFNLANCCRESGESEQAAVYYEQVLALEPKNVSALNNFAYLSHLQQDYDRAEELYQRLLDLEPEHPGALHMLAALRGQAEHTPENAYIRELFDQYSDSFEQSLVGTLEYRVPELLSELLFRIFPMQRTRNRRMYDHCLDLGCGTGLAGKFFRCACIRLTGLDLSEKMLARAADKNIYDELLVADAVRFLEQGEQHYDLLVAADLLTYMADLKPLLQAANQCAAAGAFFVFSTEHGERENWRIRPTGRFAHNPDYVTETAERCGWKIVLAEEANLRREADAWVRGDLFAVVKKVGC